MSKTTETVWRKGPPPSIGWWPASLHRSRLVLRWWDGTHWSQAAYVTRSAARAALIAAKPAVQPRRIEWTDRPDSWPERAKT